ncbi:N-acetyltransferase, partial [Bacillus sp. AFS073361]
QSENTAPLLSLWLESTTEAHPFIDAQYWIESEPLVRDTYLPGAETWVWEEEGDVRGFISVMESQFIGALFVATAHAGKGIGHALIHHVQQQY